MNVECRIEVLLDDLAGDWHSTPRIDTDGSAIYAIRDRSLRRIEV